MTTSQKAVSDLRCMVRGSYDLQALRMQMGLRLCANFRAKLDEHSAMTEGDGATEEDIEREAAKVIDRLRSSHARLTDGIARNRELPARSGFTGDELISSYSELVIVSQYFDLLRQEGRSFRQLEGMLDEVPIWTSYLRDVRGVGPAMAAVMVTSLDPHRARHISHFWAYAGLDVGPDGAGRSRREAHLVDREYRKSDGTTATRKSVTYNPWLKSKLMGVLADSFMRTASPWRVSYDGYRHRIESDPNREKVTLPEWKRRHKAGEDVSRLWAPGRVNTAAKRYMVKMFLADLWVHWRILEGLPVTVPYREGKLGMKPHYSS